MTRSPPIASRELLEQLVEALEDALPSLAALAIEETARNTRRPPELVETVALERLNRAAIAAGNARRHLGRA